MDDKLAWDRLNSGPAQQEEAELFSPYDILSMLLRRFHWIMVSTTIVFGIAAVVAARWPDEFKADTLILVDPQKVPERYVNTTVSMDVSGRLSTINQQLMSSTRLQRIIDTYDLYKSLKNRKTQEEIIEQMRSDIKVEIVRNFEGGGGNKSLGAFRITYMGRKPAEVAQVCNQLASLFIEENLKVREQQAEGTSEFIDTRLDLAKKNLEEEETRLRDFKMKNVGQLPEQAPSAIAQLNAFESQMRSETETINHLRTESQFYTAQVNNLLQARESASTPVTLGESGGALQGAAPAPTSEKLVALKQQRASLVSNLEQAQLRYTAEHPDLRKSKALLESIDRDIEKEQKRLAAVPPPPMVFGNNPSGQSGDNAQAGADPKDPVTALRARIKLIESEIAERTKKAETLQGQLKTLQERLDSMPMREQEMSATERDVSLLRANYNSLLEKKLSADMAADMEKRQKSERFTILDPARIPEKPFRPQRTQILGGSFGAGVGLGLILIFITELRDKSVKKEDELTRLGLRILGRIPMVVTSEETQLRRRRKMRNWALGTVATLSTLAAGATVAYFVTKTTFNI